MHRILITNLRIPSITGYVRRRVVYQNKRERTFFAIGKSNTFRRAIIAGDTSVLIWCRHLRYYATAVKGRSRVGNDRRSWGPLYKSTCTVDPSQT